MRALPSPQQNVEVEGSGRLCTGFFAGRSSVSSSWLLAGHQLRYRLQPQSCEADSRRRSELDAGGEQPNNIRLIRIETIVLSQDTAVNGDELSGDLWKRDTNREARKSPPVH